MPVTYHFSLPGITCAACINSIETLIEEKRAPLRLTNYSISLGTKTGWVTVDEGQESQATKEALKDLLDVYDITNISVELSSDPPPPASPLPWYKRVLQSHWFLGGLGTLCGLAIMIACLFTGGLPLAVMIGLGVFSVVLTLIIGASSFYQAGLKLIKARTLTMDTLFAISALTIIAVSIASFFVPWLPMMFEAGLLIFGFRHIGLAIEESIKDKLDLRRTYQSALPQRVRVLIENEPVEKDLPLVAIDEILIIQPGELIPLDGFSLSEGNWIDDSTVSGAFIPKIVEKNKFLLAGMRVFPNSPPLILQVKATQKASYLARLDQSLAKAHMEKAPLEEMATKVLQYFIPAVIGLAILSGIIIGCFFPPALAIQCAVSVLVSACPCTLGLVVPLAVMIGNKKAAAHGVQFKSGKALQAAAAIDAVVFDLNGTLTQGEPNVTRAGLFDEKLQVSELFSLAAALESRSSHPVARAICEEAREKYGNKLSSYSISELDSSYHAGLKAKLDGVDYAIGNQAFLAREGIYPDADLLQKIPLNAGDNLVFLVRQKKLLGYFVATDSLRSDTRQTINTLKAAGKTIFINTGASQEAACRYAHQLGIPVNNIHAGCENGEKKAAFIKSLQSRQYKVAMVGDAGNDGPPLACSDIGFAVQSKASHEMARQEAGAIIQEGALFPVAHGLAIARQTVSNIKQNLGFSLAYNMAAVLLTGGLLVALGITLNPAVGVAIMIIQTLLILGNAYRFKMQQSEAVPQEAEQANFGSSSYTQCQCSLPLTRSSKPETSIEKEPDTTVQPVESNATPSPIIAFNGSL